jgi:hypothetical protein
MSGILRGFLLASIEPEPQRDWAYLDRARVNGWVPLLYLWNYSVAHVRWQKRQRWHQRLLRRLGLVA